MAVIRRGQFFIIGVLLIIGLIVGVGLANIAELQTPQTQTPRQLFDQSMQEFPTAVNLAAADNRSAAVTGQRVTSYLAFQRHLFDTHGLQAQSHAAVVVPQDDSLQIVLANFRRITLTNVTVTVDGATRHREQIADGGSATFTFPPNSDPVDVTASFDADQPFQHSFSASMQRLSAVQRLRIAGEQQLWQDTRTY